MGEGIEREVFQTLMAQYLQEQAAQWLSPRADGFSTLATSHSLEMASFIPKSRLENMSVFGAVIALCLLRGVSVPPIDPVVIHFFIHDCNVHSLHPDIIGEWHPSLKKTITDWLNTGPDNDVTSFQDFFATYFDLQVGVKLLQCILVFIYVCFRSLASVIAIRCPMMPWRLVCCIGRSLGQSRPIIQNCRRLSVALGCRAETDLISVR